VGKNLKISSRSGDKFWVHLEAETDEEAQYLYKFFVKNCKKIAKKFPLKDKDWDGAKEFYKSLQEK